MFIHPTAPRAVVVYRIDGTPFQSYGSLEELLGDQPLGFFRDRLDYCLRPVKNPLSDVVGANSPYRPARFVVMDDLGEIVSPSWLTQEKLKRLGRQKDEYAFRRDPVPHTRCRRASHHYSHAVLRHPRTYQEMRLNEAHRDLGDDYGVHLVRNRRRLRTAWDDIVRSDIDQKNWKRQRRRQWR